MKAADDVNWDTLVSRTKGYSGADISNVCREAAMMNMRKKMLEGQLDFEKMKDLDTDDYCAPITMKDFTEALKNI